MQDKRTYVLRFAADHPHRNFWKLNSQFIQIHPDDLLPVLKGQLQLARHDIQDEMAPIGSDELKREFQQSARHFCKHPVIKNSFIETLLRPHIVIHSGAGQANDFCSDSCSKAVGKVGKLARRYGFSLFYGGGNTGDMGRSLNEYMDTDVSFPGQNSVQVTLADFVLGVKSKNGMRPKNEGLSLRPDVTVVLPVFDTRRFMLVALNRKEDVVITCPGADGSQDEVAGVKVLKKTGLADTNAYVLNVQVPMVVDGQAHPTIKVGYWDHYRKQTRDFVTYGYGTEEAFNAMIFMSKPGKIFDHLMRKLDSEGNNPHAVYERRLKAYEQACKEHPDLRPKTCEYQRPGEKVVRLFAG